MSAALWLVLSSLLCSLQLQTGSFPKPLTAEEERMYLARSAKGDLEAQNILIERNLRLVAHIKDKARGNFLRGTKGEIQSAYYGRTVRICRNTMLD